uniref:Uncharacterized protein n=1 Tax=Pseudodiaptomus poplesia TaxID=213370 RepID=A0A1S6GLA3_9MAXI|nr:hypothetical protein [Pseudodiaptomus poplesia]
MGKGPKHSLNRNRNNPIFKVAGASIKDKKGKPKEVTTKIKAMSQLKHKSSEKIARLDSQLGLLQQTKAKEGVSLGGQTQASKSVTPSSDLANGQTVTNDNIHDLADSMEDQSVQ